MNIIFSLKSEEDKEKKCNSAFKIWKERKEEYLKLKHREKSSVKEKSIEEEIKRKRRKRKLKLRLKNGLE